MRPSRLISFTALALAIFSYVTFNQIVGHTKIAPENITEAEKARIDEWILRHNLNEYGDPKDTMYAGGTPLFSETTGESLDRYVYIIENHCRCPWDDQEK